MRCSTEGLGNFIQRRLTGAGGSAPADSSAPKPGGADRMLLDLDPEVLVVTIATSRAVRRMPLPGDGLLQRKLANAAFRLPGRPTIQKSRVVEKVLEIDGHQRSHP